MMYLFRLSTEPPEVISAPLASFWILSAKLQVSQGHLVATQFCENHLKNISKFAT